MTDLTHDSFLSGRLRVWQPRDGFRAGIDTVFLGAAVPARANQAVLELGCGAGTASLCLGARVPGLRQHAVELQADYAMLANRNADENEIPLTVFQSDLSVLPPEVRGQSYDHVFFNPPYYQRDRTVRATDAGREMALGEVTPLSVWIDVAVRRLVPKGCLTLIHRAQRVPEILSAMDDRMGGVELLPLAPRAGRVAKLILLRATKGARAPFSLLPPTVLHANTQHLNDGDDYAVGISNVLRDGAAFPWPNC